MLSNFIKKFRKFYKTKLGKFVTKFAISFVATLLIVGIALGGAYSYVFSGMDKEQTISKEELGIEVQDYHTDDIINIALFGIDTDDDSMAGRSDSIIVVTLDNKTGEIRLSAIQRDTYVTIEGRGKDKINHAYAFGGAALAVKTLNQNFGLDITDYAVINFANLEKVIDVLGGIEMEVTETYRKQANKHIKELASSRGVTPKLIESAGTQTLSGVQVLGMSRARYNVGGTGARSEMHEIILNACYAKLKTKNILEYPNIAKELLGLVQTTLSSGEVVSVGMKVLLSGYEIRQEVFPLEEDQKNGGGGQMIGGVWYLTYNEEEGNQHIRDFIYNGVLPTDTAEE
ncbi:MAG: LCP family protein [Clostridia bacterium]|nr:LCP family protein [Clostridia bacterium]